MYIIVCVIGCLLGGIITNFVKRRRAMGILRIDMHNPDKVIYRIEVNDLSQLPYKSYIYLKIDKNANLSQN